MLSPTFNYEVKILPKEKKYGKQALNMACLGFVIAIFMSLTTEALIKEATMLIALGILLVIIFLGVIFDMVGSAVLTAEEKPFHAMSAKKVPGAKQSIYLIRNADKVATFCNDVVGDIAGTLSGAAGATIVLMLVNFYPEGKNIFSVLTTSLIAALTIGGKSMSKSIGLRNWFIIINFVGKVTFWLEKNTGLVFLEGKKNGRKRVS